MEVGETFGRYYVYFVKTHNLSDSVQIGMFSITFIHILYLKCRNIWYYVNEITGNIDTKTETFINICIRNT